MAGEIARDLSLIASYSYIEARDPQNVAGDQRRQNVAPNKATLSVLYRPSAVPGLSLGGGIFHYGERYGGLADTPRGTRAPFYLDSYTTVDLNAGYEVALGRGRPTLYTRMTLRNLGNVDFDQMSNFDLCVDPGMPRTLYGTVGLRL
jgi:outer membrane receptor protein involved in Fe transport